MDGLLLIDKPQGITSHDVVARLRRKLQIRQIGHAGTLDPMATGLLILMIGRSTKLSQQLMSSNKVYQGTLKLGETTDSQDAEGAVIATAPIPALDFEVLEATAKGFLGDQYQIPPMYSAKKIDGVPLYKLARKGQEIEREPRFIHISHFDLFKIDLPSLDFEIGCSKGTYIRTVAHDFGKKLGCGAHLTRLRRIQSGSFNINEGIELAKVEELSLSEIQARLIKSYKMP